MTILNGVQLELNSNLIKFNYNTLNAIQIPLNWILIQIQLMINEMQIGAKGIKYVLVTMVLKRKETLK
jgi:hypothetical protein